MSNGHSWSNIKKYTLSEIGVFLKSVYIKRELERVENFSLGWMSSNLTHKGMIETIESMKKNSIVKRKETQNTKEDVAKEWARLASFQQR